MSEPVSAGEPVVVTGGTGFIGSAVCARAVARGQRPVVLLREIEMPLAVPDVENAVVDWTDRAGLADTLRRLAPASIIHCAGASARTGVGPAALYEANVCLVARLLEAVEAARPDASVVVLSSAAVYGPDAPTPTDESSPLDPQTEYGISKVMAETLARAYAAGHGVRTSIARPFNVLGPGEPAGSVVSAIADQLLAGPAGTTVPVSLREVVSVRDFVDVEDAADALLTLGERGAAGEAYNVCSGAGTTVAELLEMATLAWDRTADLTLREPDAAGSVSIGSCDKLRRLGWAPRRTLVDTLSRMAAGR